MVPAEEGFYADDVAVPDVDLRLIVEHEFITAKGEPKVGFELQALACE